MLRGMLRGLLVVGLLRQQVEMLHDESAIFNRHLFLVMRHDGCKVTREVLSVAACEAGANLPSGTWSYTATHTISSLRGGLKGTLSATSSALNTTRLVPQRDGLRSEAAEEGEQRRQRRPKAEEPEGGPPSVLLPQPTDEALGDERRGLGLGLGLELGLGLGLG